MEDIQINGEGLYFRLCNVCGKPITHKYKSQIKQKTCSHSCQLKGNKLRKGKIPANAYKKGETAGEKNVRWAGDKITYGGIHDYIASKYGRPQICEDCGRKNLGSRRHHWANITGKYSRERSDWKRLCAKCHFKMDIETRFKSRV